MSAIAIALLQIVNLALNLYMYVVVAHVILSWLVAFNIINPQQELVRIIGNFLFAITEPVLGRIRKVIPPISGIDLSPLILFFIIFFLESLVDQAIMGMR